MGDDGFLLPNSDPAPKSESEVAVGAAGMWANASARLSKGCGRSAVHSPACPQPAPTEARDAGLQLERPTALATGMKTVRLEGELGCSIAPMKLGPKYTSQRRAEHHFNPTRVLARASLIF